MQTYLEQCKNKKIEINEESFDDFVDFWHTSEQTRNISLHDAIGITWEEYSENILNQHDLLKLLKEKIK